MLQSWKQVIGVLVVCFGVQVQLSAHSPVEAAVSRVTLSSVSTRYHSIPTSKVQPQSCVNGNATVNPSNQGIQSDFAASVSATWHCGDIGPLYVRFYWGDGNSDNYYCYLNCGSGTTKVLNHYYPYHSYDYTYVGYARVIADGVDYDSTPFNVDVYPPPVCHPGHPCLPSGK